MLPLLLSSVVHKLHSCTKPTACQILVGIEYVQFCLFFALTFVSHQHSCQVIILDLEAPS